jgi:hypothetical protein
VHRTALALPRDQSTEIMAFSGLSASSRGDHTRSSRPGTRDAAKRRMLRMKDTNKLVKNILRAMPAIPFIAPKKKTSIAPFLLGALGVAVFGGVAAVMIFSPRTRYRALDIAKDGYGKVRGQIDQRGWASKLGLSRAESRTTTPGGYQNGLVSDSESTYQNTGV